MPRHAAHAKAPEESEAFAAPPSEFTLVLERYHSREQTHVNVPHGVTQILEGAFKGHDELVSVSLPDTLQSIGPKAFSGCASLREVRVPDAVFEIGHAAFSGCSSLERVVLPDGLLEISESLFQGCSSLACVEGGDEVDEVASNAFAACAALEELPLITHARKLGSGAFAGCAFREVVLPERMEAIANEAFRSCRHLARVKLPEEAGALGKNVFLNCGNLVDLQGFEPLAERFPGAFPRSFTDKLGLLRPQDESRETREYVRLHKGEAAEIRAQLGECREAIRRLRSERDSLGAFDRAGKQEIDKALLRERAKRTSLKARLETLENPTYEQLLAQKREAAQGLA